MAVEVTSDFWTHCLNCLQQELPQRQFDTWIKALQTDYRECNGEPIIEIRAPNKMFMQWIRERYLKRIVELAESYFSLQPIIELKLASSPVSPGLALNHKAGAALAGTDETGNQSGFGGLKPPRGVIGNSRRQAQGESANENISPLPVQPIIATAPAFKSSSEPPAPRSSESNRSNLLDQAGKTRLNPEFGFANLVTGRANDLARAAAMQVAANPGLSYNPLFVYGGVGLGKTHLVHALGNQICQDNPDAVVRYVHAEDYYAHLVRSIEQQSYETFKRYYRSLDVLLIDDIQFFNNKKRTQEEFFHVFNALTEAKKQIVITCDTYPKDVQGLQDRLISRFDWGLTVQIEPPEPEMRVAILKRKAAAENIDLNDDVAFLIAKNLRSNVRELEGALKKVLAFSNFHHREINLELAKEALKDLLSAHNRQLTIEHIQKTVADYYKIKVAEMYSKKRSRIIARPRQIAMFLAKELTPMSLPAIGEAFGGRDHTTVLHACRTITELRLNDPQLNHDVHVLSQVLRG